MTRSLLSRFRSSTAGATAVEFALVAGPLFLMLFSTIEFARLYWTREALQSAAIAGARCMGVKQAECAPKGDYDADATVSFIQTKAGDLYVSVPAADVVLAPDTDCSGAKGFSEVKITHSYTSALSGILEMLTGDVGLSASACFPNQQA